jgi:flagellar protein FlbB
MARRNGGIGKTIALLFLIIILVLGGLMWFDYLGVIHAKKMFAPVYKLIGLTPQTSTTATKSNPFSGDLDEDRFAKRIEALDARTQELDKRETDISNVESQNEAIAKELEERRKSQDEREKTFNNQVKKYDDRNRNIEQIVSYLNSMPPQTAVEQLVGMVDQDIIDILRKADEMAAASRTTSMSSVWLMNFPADRAAAVERKMANKPASLD